MEPATDLEILVKKGFPENEAKKALLETRGNLEAAILYLTRGPSTNSWNKDTGHEWLDHVNGEVLLTSTGRAIRKSTYFLSVPKWQYADDHVYYTINVIMRDGRQWKILKRYSEIHEFWRSMPIGSTTHFTHKFPQPVLWSGTEDNEFNDQRRLLLDEWFGELSIDEKAMSKPRVVTLLDNFLNTSAQPPPATSFNTHSDLPSWTVIPQANISTQPLSLEVFSSHLPCKLNLVELFPQRPQTNTETVASLSITGLDVTTKQISKDLSRDRIIIQGRRYEGSESGLNGILEATFAAAEHTIREAGGVIYDHTSPPSSLSPGDLSFSREIIEELCLTSLGQLGRTESAYACLTALNMIIDLGSTPDLILVPESVLAHPLLLRFRILQPQSNSHSKSHSTRSSTSASSRESPLLRTSNSSKGQEHVSPLTHNVQKKGSPLPASSSSASPSTPPLPPPSHSSHSASSGADRSRRSPNIHHDLPSHPPSQGADQHQHHHETIKPAIVCDMQATTVYRFSHCETMQTTLQIKATFCQSIKLPCERQSSLPPRDNAPAPPHEMIPTDDDKQKENKDEMTEKERENETVQENRRKQIQRLFLLSKSLVIFDRDTRTSQRDWK